MQDLGLTYIDGVMDLDLGDGGATVDTTLRTAVLVSLFSDRRADDGDVLPDGGTDRRGWWGDMFSDVDKDRIGSRLWLLSREKQLPEILRRAEVYAKEALQWMLDDGIAEAITVIAEAPDTGVLALSISISSKRYGQYAATVDDSGIRYEQF